MMQLFTDDQTARMIAQTRESASSQALLTAVSDANPVQARRDSELQRQAGFPLPVVDANSRSLAEIRRRQNEAQDTLSRAPTLAPYLADSHTYGRIADDLGSFEAIAAAVERHRRDFSGSGRAARPVSLAGPIYGAGAIIPALLSSAAAVGEGLLGGAIETLGRVGQGYGRIIRSQSTALQFANPFLGPGLDVIGAALEPRSREAFRPVAQYGRDLPVPTTSGIVNRLQIAAQSAGGSAISLLASAATRNPLTGVALAGVAQEERAYEDGIRSGLSHEDAQRYADIDGLIEGGLEYISNRFFVGDITARSGFLRTLRNQIISEVPSELITTAGQEFNRFANIEARQGATFGDFSHDLFLGPSGIGIDSDLADTLITTILATGMSTGASHPIARVIDRRLEQVRAQQGARSVDQIMEGAAQSVTRRESPEDFRAIVEGLAEGTAVENLYIPAENVRSLFQSPEDLAADDFWGAYADEVSEAEALGGDVVIPLSDAATHLAGTPQWQALREHVRTSAGGMSPAEAADAETAFADAVQQSGEELAAQFEAEHAAMEPARKVYEGMRDKLMAAGFRADAASQLATQFAQKQATRAQRLGRELTGQEADAVDVRQVLPERLASVIQAADVPDAGLRSVIAEMQRGRNARSERTRFGPSLLEFLAARGGIEDIGGELAHMGAGFLGKGFAKKGQKKLIKRRSANAPLDSEGKPILESPEHGYERAMEAATAAGYLPEVETQRLVDGEGVSTVTTDALIEAIRDELGGTPRYAEGNDNTTDADVLREAAQELYALLDQQGLDPSKASSAEITRAVSQYQSERMAGRGFDQVDVRSAAFKKWFGDSKVVDESGAPLVMYHTSNEKFEAFSNKGWMGFRPIYFNADLAKAKDSARGAKVEYAAYLRMETPWNSPENPISWGDFEARADRIRDDGYDGAYVKDEGGVSIAVFEPTQIKSVNNSGAFDPADPRILHQSLFDDPAQPTRSMTQAQRAELEARQLQSKARRGDQVGLGDQAGGLFSNERDQRSLFQGAEVFYSALTKAVEASQTVRASAAQWIATLRKAPGVKQEELEWTGLLDFLDMQEGPVSREQLLELLSAGGIKVDEVVLGDDPDAGEVEAEVDARVEALVNEEIESRDIDARPHFVEDAPDGDGFIIYGPGADEGDVFTTAEEAEAEAERLNDREEESLRVDIANDIDRSRIEADVESEMREGKETQFASWTSDATAGGTFNAVSDTYRELLITLPIGQGKNPTRAASTHWDVESVVAHARFMEKRDADGNRVLFIEEVQSDWHQKGRDEGYEQAADPARVAELVAAADAAQDARDAAEKEFSEARFEIIGPLQRIAGPLGLRDEMPGVGHHLSELVAFSDRSDVRAAIIEEADAPGSDSKILEIVGRAREAAENYDRTRLAYNEARQALANAEQVKGIPDAPFKSSWPALVMKRMIRWAVDNGFERVAWTTGAEQNERYPDSLGEIGEITVRPMGDGERVRFGFPETRGAVDAIVQRGLGEKGMQPFGGVVMTRKQATEVLGREAGERLFDAGLEGADVFDGGDVRVDSGREAGMKAFYDRNLVNITNDLIKKYGGKVETVQLTKPGYNDMIAGELVSSKQDYTNPGFTITPKMAEAAASGFSLFQSFADGPRGRVTFTTDGRSVIDLFAARDLSTAIHEFGHIYLEELKADSAEALNLDTPEGRQLFADYEAVKAWFKREGHEIGADGTIPTEAHELWARGFERFAMEGKAPSSALRRAFEAFRSWLINIYKTAASLKAPITPEIRDVMARMMATDEEIANATEEANIKLAYDSAEAAGMTEQEYGALTTLATEARDEAHTALLTRVMATVRASRTKEYREQEQGVRAEVAAAVDDQPVFRALRLLRNGKIADEEARKVKLDKQFLIDTYGPEAIDAMPRSVPPIFGDTDAAHPDLIAEESGFTSGDEMIRTLMAHEQTRQELRAAGDKRSPRQVLIDEETAARMAERYGDPLRDGSIEEEARALIHNDKQGEVLAAEIRAVGRRIGKRPTPYSVARQWAAEKIAAGKVVDVASGSALQRYQRAARMAAKEAEAAIIKGDHDEVYRQKQRQMLNTALISEGKKAKDRVDIAVRRLGKVARKRTIKSVDQDYLDQAHGLLEQVDLRSRTQAEVELKTTFAEWVAAQEAEGRDVIVTPSFAAELGQTHWSRLSVEQLLGLDATVQQILHLGRDAQTVMDGEEKRNFDEAKGELVASAGGSGKQRNVSAANDPSRYLPERIKSRIRWADAALLKSEQMFDWLDAGNSNGPWNRYLFKPLADAQGVEGDLMRVYAEKINALIKAIPRKQAKDWARDVDTPELINNVSPDPAKRGKPFIFGKDQIVMIALNMGNEGNIQRLLDGYGWSRAQVDAVLDRHMTAEDWAFAQGVWDALEDLKPALFALERRVNGFEPNEVLATPVATKFGEFRGGYFPAVADPSYSTSAEIQEQGKLGGRGFFKASTRASSSKERAAASDRPLFLNMAVITGHISEVIHDITHREAVIQARKFLADGEVRNSVSTALGPEYLRAIDGWLENIATPNVADAHTFKTVAWIGRHLHKGTSLVGLGYRVSTVLLQPLGLANLTAQIGERAVLGGMASFTAGQRATHNIVYDEVTARSAEMRDRFSTMDASIAEMYRDRAKNGLQRFGPGAFEKHAFDGILYADLLITAGGWIGAFNKGLRDGMNEAEATYYADKAIRTSQGAGGQKDKSAILRQNAIIRSFYPFFSYLNALYNQQRDVGRRIRNANSVGEAAEAARRMWWIVVAPGLLKAMLLGDGPDEDDEESWGAWLTKAVVLDNIASIPLAGPIANALGNGWGYSASSFQRGGEGTVQAVRDLRAGLSEEDEASGSWLKNAITTAGFVFAKPTGQIGAAAQFGYDVQQGEAEPETVRDYWTGATTGRMPAEVE